MKFIHLHSNTDVNFRLATLVLFLAVTFPRVQASVQLSIIFGSLFVIAFAYFCALLSVIMDTASGFIVAGKLVKVRNQLTCLYSFFVLFIDRFFQHYHICSELYTRGIRVCDVRT